MDDMHRANKNDGVVLMKIMILTVIKKHKLFFFHYQFKVFVPGKA